MKRAIFAIAIIMSVFLMAGRDFYLPDAGTSEIKKECFGYTVIEAGKGVDCNGDTIKLIKKHGFFEVASEQKNGSPDSVVL